MIKFKIVAEVDDYRFEGEGTTLRIFKGDKTLDDVDFLEEITREFLEEVIAIYKRDVIK